MKPSHVCKTRENFEKIGHKSGVWKKRGREHPKKPNFCWKRHDIVQVPTKKWKLFILAVRKLSLFWRKNEGRKNGLIRGTICFPTTSNQIISQMKVRGNNFEQSDTPRLPLEGQQYVDCSETPLPISRKTFWLAIKIVSFFLVLGRYFLHMWYPNTWGKYDKKKWALKTQMVSQTN